MSYVQIIVGLIKVFFLKLKYIRFNEEYRDLT